MNKLKHITFQFKADSVTTEERNGVPVGILKGFASTWGIDRGGDQIMKGAFSKSINRHKADNRPIRMYDGHDSSKLIGGYPIDKVMETDQGLYVEGEVNLQVQRGAEVYALAKQGVLSDFSIGFNVPNKNSIKQIKIDGKSVTQFSEIELWEISPVSEPMNADANILAVKGATSFGGLPLADRSRPWDSHAAVNRIRDFTGSLDAPSSDYKKAFLWYDSSAPENFGSYKLPIADVENGDMVAVPRAIFAAAAVMNGARGGVDIPSSDRADVESHINSYYSKMNLESPIGKGIDITIIESCQTHKDVEQLLKFVGISDDGRKILISKIKSFSREGVDEKVSNDLKGNANAFEIAANSVLLNTLSIKR